MTRNKLVSILTQKKGISIIADFRHRQIHVATYICASECARMKEKEKERENL